MLITLLLVKDEIIPMLEDIKSIIRTDGEEIKSRLHNLELVTRGICQHIQFWPTSLPLRIPGALVSSAPSPALSSVSGASSASSSSGVHVARMSMPGPPSAGPSGSGPSIIRCKFFPDPKTFFSLILFSRLQQFQLGPEGSHAPGGQVRRGPGHPQQHAHRKYFVFVL